jgi:glycosyltransferase involved in cell wall biosynthesis
MCPPGRRTLQNSSLVLAQNFATADVARSMGARNVALMLADGLPSNWIRTDARSQPDWPTILWIGRFQPHKAPLLALEAFAHLRRRIDCHLLMVGDGPLLKVTRQAAVRLEMHSHVTFAGAVEWRDIPQYLDKASILLFTSLRDAFGAQVLEALGRGLPVVALNHQGIADMAPDVAVRKVSPTPTWRGLAPALAEAAHEALIDGLWTERSAIGLEWACRQSWPAKAKTMSSMLESLS